MRQIKFNKNPYSLSRHTYKTDTFEFQPSINVLVGCNGSGKTTLLSHIKTVLSGDDEVFVKLFDNYVSGGQHIASTALFNGSTEIVATAMCSSEGEKITLWLGQTARQIGGFIKNLPANTKEIWLLFDALDSGLSIDNISDVKEYLFKTILKHITDKDVYIVVSANSFEFADGENCINITTGKQFKCNDYNCFKSEVLKTRKFKDR